MRLTIELMPEEESALAEFAKELSPLPTEEAATFAIREFLILRGYLGTESDNSPTYTLRDDKMH